MTPSLNYELLKSRLATEPHTWLITGVAGFIGSNLLETLLKFNQRVVGLDNFATGHQRNLDEVQSLVSAEQWANFNFINGDIRNLDDCKSAMTFSSSLRGDEVDAAHHCERNEAIQRFDRKRHRVRRQSECSSP